MMDNLERIKRIVEQAANLPRIDPPSEGWNPTPEELAKSYAQLAFAYATSTMLLQQGLPLIVEELFAIHTERELRRRRAKVKVVKGGR